MELAAAVAVARPLGAFILPFRSSVCCIHAVQHGDTHCEQLISETGRRVNAPQQDCAHCPLPTIITLCIAQGIVTCWAEPTVRPANVLTGINDEIWDRARRDVHMHLQ